MIMNGVGTWKEAFGMKRLKKATEILSRDSKWVSPKNKCVASPLHQTAQWMCMYVCDHQKHYWNF